MQTWKPPDVDMLKLNIDGAYTWGVVVRDPTGDVVACMAGKYEHFHDAFAAELQAAVCAVDLATQPAYASNQIPGPALTPPFAWRHWFSLSHIQTLAGV